MADVQGEPALRSIDAEAGDWLPHLQALHRRFLETAGDTCLLWVNPAQGDPFESDELVEACRVRVPILHPRFDPQFAPYLVSLVLNRFADAEVFKRSVQLAWDAWSMSRLQAGNGQPVCGWIIGATKPEELARHWASHCHLHKDGGLDKLLRFHDPAVREWLWPALSVAQQRQLLGPARALVSFTRQRKLLSHELAEPERHEHTAGTLPGKLVLTSQLWGQVDDYATVHAAWMNAISTPGGLDAADEFDPRPVLQALAQATQYGITDSHDRALFATHALQCGAKFHTDLRLQKVWPLTKDGEFYGGALEEVTGVPVDQLHKFLGG